MRFAVLALAVHTTVGIDTEFHGFIHLKNWPAHFAMNWTSAGDCTAVEQGYCFTYPDGSPPPITVTKDICSADPNCIAMGGGKQSCSQVPCTV